ncbi:MAG: 1,4-alpha-glucan branching protein GlgB [Peptococcaceae bacterium]|nr:1,4-alpha-glucan branching protein GlgB [Peptococcaceae bacterium]
MIRENPQNDLPGYLFHQGTNFNAYDFFGCHFDAAGRRAVFRVWAPNAREISVVGDWNDWNDEIHAMRLISDTGVWEAVVYGVLAEQKYKYSILGFDGKKRLKADPFAFYAEISDSKASIVYNIDGYDWRDEDWMRERRFRALADKPVNIYEIHAGSWRAHIDEQPLSYTELADELIPYLTEMGYTHLELMPLMEHSFARSWGYQISGYFAPTSRYGEPYGLMALIDKCHEAGIGVILDWAPAHFSQEAHGLAEFDGAPLYEAKEPNGTEQMEWSTRRFDYGRTEVQSFLISNAIFWLNMYHADGLRAVSLSSILWLDHGKKQGEWAPNSDGGNENIDAAHFLQKLNAAVSASCPGVVMIAEEPGPWPLVTTPVAEGGLGFHFKWNTDWTGDMMAYVSVDPIYRKLVHDKITSSLYYAFDENFILPVSHNEVVYGKRSLLDKMPGEYEWKFAGLKAFLGYMMAYPGKKLLFMGYETGQFREWAFDSPIEWMLLEYPAHRMLQDYVRALNRFYLSSPPLWEYDTSWEGFRWISADDSTQNIVIFMRVDKAGQSMVVLQNFAPVTREDYCFGVPDEGSYVEVFNSDSAIYGGWGHENGVLRTEETPLHGFPCSLRITAPPLSTVFFRYTGQLQVPD